MKLLSREAARRRELRAAIWPLSHRTTRWANEAVTLVALAVRAGDDGAARAMVETCVDCAVVCYVHACAVPTVSMAARCKEAHDRCGETLQRLRELCSYASVKETV